MYNYLIYKSILSKELPYHISVYENPLIYRVRIYSIFFGLSEHFFDSSFFVILKQKCDIITQGGKYIYA